MIAALSAREARAQATVQTLLQVAAALGLPLGANHANQLDSFLAPLNLLSAPLTNKFRVRVGGAYDKALREAWFDPFTNPRAV